MISVNKNIIVFAVLFVSNVFSQNSLQQQFNYANHLFNQEKYFDAITEFKRLQFFDKENYYSFQTNLLVGKCYKSGAKFDDAIKYFTLAEINAKSNSDIFSSKILKARTNILRRTNNQATKILSDLENDIRFDSLKSEIEYWKGWNFMFLDDWEEAYKIFSQSNLDTALANICKTVVEEKYNEDFAKYSSYLIPGLGQFYTEEYLSGTLSLAWNILFGYLSINSILEDRVFDGIITANFLWLRFYLGNIQNAEKFVLQKNLKISNNALYFLQYNFSGKKP